MPLLFVYKTLLNPKTREQALGEKVEGKRAKAKGEHKEIEEQGYSTIIPSKTQTVEGEVLNLTNEQLKKLDKWESEYKRKQIELTDGTKVWAYEREKKFEPEKYKEEEKKMNKANVIGLIDYNSNDLIIKSFTNQIDENKISLALNYVDLIKGKKSEEGEERVYKNRIFVKKGRHWIEKKEGKTLKSHAREVGEHELERTIKESGDPLLRQHAHSELKRRQKYEYGNKEKKGGK